MLTNSLSVLAQFIASSNVSNSRVSVLFFTSIMCVLYMKWAFWSTEKKAPCGAPKVVLLLT